MTALAEPSHLGPHTLTEWHEADQPGDGSRLELLAGSWSVSPAPGFRHQRMADRLCRLLDERLPGCAVSAVAVDISTHTRTGLIPDVVVLRKAPEDDIVPVGLVTLLVEVWSPGNTHRERIEKRAAYAAAGVRYFWEVDTDEDGRIVLTCQRLVAGGYLADVRLSASSGPTTVTAAPVPVQIDLAALNP